MGKLCAWLLVSISAVLANAQQSGGEFPLWRTITGEGQARPPSERFIGRAAGTPLSSSAISFSLPFHPFRSPVPLPDQPADGLRNPNKLQYLWHPVKSYRSTPSSPRTSVPRPWTTPSTPTTTVASSGSLSLFDQYYRNGGGEWSLWTQWSPCVNNERMRARACYHAPATHCPGSNMEKQKCTGGISVDTDAHRPIDDPWKEERDQAAAQLGI